MNDFRLSLALIKKYFRIPPLEEVVFILKSSLQTARRHPSAVKAIIY